MAEEERVDVTDISNSPAFVALNELLGDGTLTAAQVGGHCPSPSTLPPPCAIQLSIRGPCALERVGLGRRSRGRERMPNVSSGGLHDDAVHDSPMGFVCA